MKSSDVEAGGLPSQAEKWSPQLAGRIASTSIFTRRASVSAVSGFSKGEACISLRIACYHLANIHLLTARYHEVHVIA